MIDVDNFLIKDKYGVKLDSLRIYRHDAGFNIDIMASKGLKCNMYKRKEVAWPEIAEVINDLLQEASKELN